MNTGFTLICQPNEMSIHYSKMTTMTFKALIKGKIMDTKPFITLSNRILYGYNFYKKYR